MNNAVTVIEPGTTKLSVLTCRKAQNGSLKLIGLGQVRYSGVQRMGGNLRRCSTILLMLL